MKKNNTQTTIQKTMLLWATVIAITLLLFTFTTPTHAKEPKRERVESQLTQEVKRAGPVTQNTLNTSLVISQTETSSETLGPNLILNPSFQSMNSSGNPTGWYKGGYGTNTRQLTYPAQGNTDTKATKVTLTNYVNGDAKWFFEDVNVNPGKQYQFSDYSMSNVTSVITVRYKTSSGVFTYKDIATVSPSATYQKTSVKITIPANVVSLTIFHLINSNGNLTTDDYALNEVVTTSISQNLVENGNFETIGPNSAPTGWNKGGWGANTRVFTYPVTSQTNSNAAQLTISDRVSGDAKWYFNPISVSPGTYTYSDQVISSVPSTITVQFYNSDGSVTYKDILKLPAESSLTTSTVNFSVGVGVSKITIFHLIQSVGTLTIDNVSVVKKSEPKGIFTTGAVTLRFDDGWLSQYENAIPKMQSLGIHGTFYIVSQQKSDDGYPGFMSANQIKEIYNMGNEIGAHTRTHPFLSQLTPAEQQNEIAGSRSDLLALNVGPILSFAYPYGDYNETSLSLLQSNGFSSGLSTIDGFASGTSQKYQIERMAPSVDTPFSQVKEWIDEAQSQKKWLIITFHDISNSGEQYSISPNTFNQIVDYIVSKNIPIVTTSQGIGSLE